MMIALTDLMTPFAITYKATPGRHHTFEKLTGVVSNYVISMITSESLDAVSFSEISLVFLG
jgi:hypothetical protein